jgi:hypothetical protein
MGVKDSRLLLIDMLKGMCGGGLDAPMTETDIFDENGEIVDDKFDEYVMQQDDEDEGRKKNCLYLDSMVGKRMKRKREDLREAKTRGTRPREKTRITSEVSDACSELCNSQLSTWIQEYRVYSLQ